MAYARLVGKNFYDNIEEDVSIDVLSIPCNLGRSSADVVINSKDSTISRVHCELLWNQDIGQYQIKCLSKNGMIIDQKRYRSGESANLKQFSAIRIGGSRLYFILPN